MTYDYRCPFLSLRFAIGKREDAYESSMSLERTWNLISKSDELGACADAPNDLYSPRDIRLSLAPRATKLPILYSSLLILCNSIYSNWRRRAATPEPRDYRWYHLIARHVSVSARRGDDAVTVRILVSARSWKMYKLIMKWGESGEHGPRGSRRVPAIHGPSNNPIPGNSTLRH